MFWRTGVNGTAGFPPLHTVLYDGDPGPQSCGSHDTEHQGDWEKGIEITFTYQDE